MINIYDPNTLGILTYCLNEQKKREEESCETLSSYEREVNGCKCDHEDSCKKINANSWPNIIDSINYLRNGFRRNLGQVENA